MSNFNQAIETLRNIQSFKHTIYHRQEDGSHNPMALMNALRLSIVLSEPLSHAGAELYSFRNEDDRLIITIVESDSEAADNWWFEDNNLYCETGFHLEIKNLEDRTEIIIHSTKCSNYCGDPLVLIARFIGQGYMVAPLEE